MPALGDLYRLWRALPRLTAVIPSLLTRSRSGDEHDKIDWRGDTFDLSSAAMLRQLGRAVALRHGETIGLRGRQRLDRLALGVLLELGCEVHDVADHRVFEPTLVADRPEHHLAHRARNADARRGL